MEVQRLVRMRINRMFQQSEDAAMKRFMSLAVVLVAAAMVLGGCEADTLKKENALLMEENENLRNELTQRNMALDEAQMEARDNDIQLAQLRRDLSDANSRPVANTSTAFDGIPGVQGSYGAGEVTATVESDVLFDPGKDSLKSSAKRSLDAVAQVLNSSYGGKPVRIGGHTDTDPIRKSGHESNYHLAFKRAYAVRDYLLSRGVSADRIYLASYGPDRPAGSKNQSRRVEVTVITN